MEDGAKAVDATVVARAGEGLDGGLGLVVGVGEGLEGDEQSEISSMVRRSAVPPSWSRSEHSWATVREQAGQDITGAAGAKRWWEAAETAAWHGRRRGGWRRKGKPWMEAERPHHFERGVEW